MEDLVFAAGNIPANAYPKADAANNDGRVTSYAAKSLLARVYLFYTGYYGADDLGVTRAAVLQGLEDVISSGEFGLIEEYHTLWPAASYVADVDNNTLDKSAYAGMGNRETVFAGNSIILPTTTAMWTVTRWLVMMGMRNTNWSPYGKGWGACTVNPALVNAFSNDDKT